MKRSSDVCPLDLRSRHVCSKGSTFGTCVLGHKLEVLVIHDPSRPVPPPTRSETQRDGTSMIVTSITGGVRRNSFMLEIL
ncbi:hypothetical protein DY000_02030309 [Brassica cretica]|uniref:Uncharacterized protein n=1 Tax=Brassica cretica TaxID=69181 RepID=A0ABQ7DXL9_BRACR|nr:hypothetical protein DY000_02030309 [Brassica cretica]